VLTFFLFSMTDGDRDTGVQARAGMTGAADLLNAEAERILEAALPAGLSLRLTGSIAVQLRCPRFGHLAREGREFHDLDFAGYKREAKQVQELLVTLGYVEDREVTVVSEGARAIYRHADSRLHVDVFFDRLDFCHVIALAGRLETDQPTLPLAELLLGKLQIVKIAEKDLMDAAVLLLEHGFSDDDREAISLARLARLCAEDWGLWRTASMNLEKLERFAKAHEVLEPAQKAHLHGQAASLQNRLEAEPKSLAWRLRAKLGDRVKWYKDVDDIH
jgi:hypothetical protein